MVVQIDAESSMKMPEFPFCGGTLIMYYFLVQADIIDSYEITVHRTIAEL